MGERRVPARLHGGGQGSVRHHAGRDRTAAAGVPDRQGAVRSCLRARQPARTGRRAAAGNLVDARVGGGTVLNQLTLLGEQDLYLFNEGSHTRLWEHLGAHAMGDGVLFGVWAPNARRVSVVGDFNGWDRETHPLQPCGDSGIWEGFVPGASVGDVYKFHVTGPGGYEVDKADPFAVRAEEAPRT